MMTDIRATLMGYLEEGLCVIPCRQKTIYDENGEERSKAKQALVPWAGITTVTPSMVDGWLAKYPEAMWAVLTGTRSGVWVLDLDKHDSADGVESLKAYCTEHGHDLPKNARMQRTHSGGYQLFFKLPSDGRKVKTVAGIMPGVDVRGEGGYACVPPSVNQDTGGAYRWVNDEPMTDAPEWLLELVCEKPTKPAWHTREGRLSVNAGGVGASLWGRKALEDEIAELEQAPQGERNQSLNRAACKLGSIVAGGGLDEQNVRGALERAAAFIGLSETEAVATINSGLRRGMQNPRMPEARHEYSIIPGNARRGQQALSPMVGDDEEPMPLRRPPKEQEPYPVDAFFEFADALDDISEHGFIPQSVTGTTMLIVFSLLSQRLANVCSRRYQTPLSLFGLVVASPGDGKSETESVLMKRIRERERRDTEYYRGLRDEYEAEVDAWKAEYESVRNTKKISKDERTEAMKELMRNKPKPPNPPYWTLSNPNIEGLYRFLTDRPYAGLFSDEGGIFLGGNAMNQENAMKTAASFTSLWSGGSLDKSRGGEGTSKLYGVRLCSNLMIQPVIAQKVFSDELFSGQGYLYRQLATWPQPPERRANGMRLEDLPSVQTFYRACDALLDRPERRTEDGTLVFEEVRLTEEAQAEYDAYYDHTHSNAVIGADGEYEPVAGFAKRSAEQAVRIAGCLALMRNPNAAEVSLECMAAGIELASWYLDEALRIRLDDMASPEILLAETLLQWFADHKRTTASISQIVRSGPSKLREAEAVRPVVDILVNHGWLVPIPGGAEVQITNTERRKCRQAWRVRLEYYVSSKHPH